MLKSKAIRVIIALLVVISILIVPVSAAQSSDNTFIMSCGTPTVSNYTGYIEVLLKDPTTKLHRVRTFMWSVYERGLDDNEYSNSFDLNGVQVNVSIYDGYYTGLSQLQISISGFTNFNSALYGEVYSVPSWTSTGTARMLRGEFYYNDDVNEPYVFQTEWQIVAYHIYGNIDVDFYSDDISNKEFYVLYAENGAIYNAISKGQQSQTDQIIQGQQEQTDEITSNQDKNASSIKQNQDKNASAIQKNDDENTQAIIDNQKELQENEKTDANDTGGGGVGSLDSAIPNKSDGFISSIGSLVSAMSYTGTDCDLPIPTVKIPEIKGVIKETVLLKDMSVPFGFWISKIPSGIMLLVQSVLTIALIVYCFKELYSVISYVLTLKGGGANE